jgi:hypothetical protein
MRVLTTSIVTTFRHAHGFFAIILITSCATWRIEIEGGGRPYQGINLGVEKRKAQPPCGDRAFLAAAGAGTKFDLARDASTLQLK